MIASIIVVAGGAGGASSAITCICATYVSAE